MNVLKSFNGRPIKSLKPRKIVLNSMLVFIIHMVRGRIRARFIEVMEVATAIDSFYSRERL